MIEALFGMETIHVLSHPIADIEETLRGNEVH